MVLSYPSSWSDVGCFCLLPRVCFLEQGLILRVQVSEHPCMECIEVWFSYYVHPRPSLNGCYICTQTCHDPFIPILSPATHRWLWMAPNKHKTLSIHTKKSWTLSRRQRHSLKLRVRAAGDSMQEFPNRSKHMLQQGTAPNSFNKHQTCHLTGRDVCSPVLMENDVA